MKGENTVYKIKEFSRFAKVSTRMLRYYDEVNLLKPAKIDEFTGYRYYSASQIPIITKIVTFRDIGFNIDEIRNLLKMKNDEDILKALKVKQDDIQKRINHERKIISDIDNIIYSFGKEKSIMNFEVKIKEIPSCKVVSTRKKVEDYSKEIDLWAKLGQYVQKSRLQPSGEPFAIYHDGEHKETDVDIEVAVPISELKSNEGSFVFREVESVPSMATVLYKGRYENIDAAFFYLAKWIEDSEYKPYGKVRQVSIKGEWNESNPDNYLVEIQMPVKK